MSAFEEFGILSELGKSLEEMNWLLPTDIQAEAIPAILGGGDVLMAAETGSGKTGAFSLPVLQITIETLKAFETSKSITEESSWRMSHQDRDSSLSLSSNGLRAQSRHFKDWHGVRGERGLCKSGKYYYEVLIADEGLVRVGFSTKNASLNLGTCSFGYGFGGTGKISNSNRFDSYGQGTAFGKSDVIGVLLNLDDGEISFTKNGINLGVAFRLPKSQRETEVFFPAVALKNAEILINFGAEPFKFSLSNSEFTALFHSSSFVSETKLSISQKRLVAAPIAIVLEPSRELAEQTYESIQAFGKYLETQLKICLLIGGVNIKDQISFLRNGVDIVICTPGRLEDLIGSQVLVLSQTRFLILDEADALLKSGYESMISRLVNSIPRMTSFGSRLQIIVSSATLHSFEVIKLSNSLLHFPTWIDLKGMDSVPDSIHHLIFKVDPSLPFLFSESPITDGVHSLKSSSSSLQNQQSETIKKLKLQYCIAIIRKYSLGPSLIFSRTKVDCDNAQKYLESHGLSSVSLHGDVRPEERKSNLEAFKKQKVSFLICTDVAARGLDVQGLPSVINLSLPDDKDNYVHRVGRVGRASAVGLAISLVSTVPEKVWYHGEFCKSRGRNCRNRADVSEGGCTTWNNEMNNLGDIEEHLGVTIPILTLEKKECLFIQAAERGNSSTYEGHASQLTSILSKLSHLENTTQTLFLKRFHSAKKM